MKQTFLSAIIAVVLFGCVREYATNPVSTAEPSLGIAPGFEFSTTSNFSLTIHALDNRGVGLKRIPLTIGYISGKDTVELGKTQTNDAGVVVFTNTLPSYLDVITVATDYPGLPSFTTAKITNGANQITLGGKTVPSAENTSGAPYRTPTGGKTVGFSYLSSFDGSGVPNNLEPVNDYIPQDLLDLINTSLPEQRPVPQYNPEYIADNIETDLQVKDSADVWVTFVTEGAGYLNSLGYYTYNLDTPPKTIDDISNFIVVFPNVSLPGSGGNLQSGNKVHLGVFPPNTGIGWFLVPNGWNGKSVIAQPEIKYSTKIFNTYDKPQYQQQTLILKDATRELLLLSFEDISRPGGDNDFNDAVFYVTANPFKSIANTNFSNAKTGPGTDTDGDGVLDKNDAYPNDPARAFDVFTPGKGVYSSLSFEDNWPAKGDYDMNDLVVDYSYHFVTNAANAVTEMSANFVVRAVGAYYKNGFGVELPIAAEFVEKVYIKGTPGNTMIKTEPKGVESGQKNAVIIVFDNAQALFNTTGMINTMPGQAFVQPVSIDMYVAFNQPVKMVDLGYAPFNAFIFVDGQREVEVHLPDQTPTNLANLKLLGSNADNSVPEKGRYYKAGNELPWAINIAQPFDYPYENRVVSETYLQFSTWAKTGGFNNKDWYTKKVGNRDDAKIYVPK